MQLQVGAHHDDRAARVVHPLAQQVLAEPALLALQHVGQGLQRPVARPGDGAAAAAVVNEGVHRLLQHALLVPHDDVRRAQLQEPLQPVVPVDHPAVEVVQVRGGEPPAVQLHHGPQLRRDDGHYLQYHPLGPVPELRNASTTSRRRIARIFRWPRRFQLLPQVLRQLVQVDLLQQLLDGFRTHAGLEGVTVLLPVLPVLVLRQQLLFLQRRSPGIDDDVGGKVYHLFQGPGRHVQQQAPSGTECP